MKTIIGKSMNINRFSSIQGLNEFEIYVNLSKYKLYIIQ